MVAFAILGSMTLLGYLSFRFMPSNFNASYATNPRGYGAQPASYRNAPANWANDTGTLTTPVKMEFILHRDISVRVGKSIVTYRGMSSKSKIKIDVVILELDPDVTYSRVIDIAKSKNGFRLGDEKLELISARKLRLNVWHYN